MGTTDVLSVVSEHQVSLLDTILSLGYTLSRGTARVNAFQQVLLKDTRHDALRSGAFMSDL